MTHASRMNCVLLLMIWRMYHFPQIPFQRYHNIASKRFSQIKVSFQSFICNCYFKHPFYALFTVTDNSSLFFTGSYAGTVYALNSVWTDPKSVCLSCSCMEGGLTCQNLQELCDLTCSVSIFPFSSQLNTYLFYFSNPPHTASPYFELVFWILT